MNQLESPADAVKFLYALHKEFSKDLQGSEGLLEFTPEEAFWAVFAVFAVCLSEEEDEREHKVKLSQLLRLYLTIYCEEIDPKLTVRDEPSVLEQLRKKFYTVREIVLQSDDAPRKLCKWLHDSVKEANIAKSLAGSLYILKVFNAIFPLPFIFVEDV